MKSSRRSYKFLFRIVLVGLILSLSLWMDASLSAHAQPVSASLYKIRLPLVMRNFPFHPNQTLTVSKTGSGSGIVTSSPAGINCGSTCSFAFPYNTTLTLSTTTTPTSIFAGWSGSSCSGIGTCKVTLDAARSVTATFNLNYHELRLGISGTGSGRVTSSPPGIDCPGTCVYSFPNNTLVTLTAAPNYPSIFAGWSDGGCSGTGACQVNMTADLQLLATFNTSNLPCNGITNCDFESGQNVGWTEYSSNGYNIVYDCSDPIFCNDIIPHSGNWLAWLGGEVVETSYIQQQISITPNAPHLVYWQWIDSADYCGLDYDYVEVFINTTRVDKYDLCTGTSTTEWVPHNIDLTAYAGQSVMLRIRSITDANGYSNLYIDDVSLLAGPLALGINSNGAWQQSTPSSKGKGK